MIVEQLWTGNSLRNFNYLIVCPETGEALAIDPLDHEQCLAHAREQGWDITQVLNTHEHGDHTGGNGPVIEATGARLLAHINARDSIKGMDRALNAGDVIKVGRSVELLALDTPGHTMAHVCLLSQTDDPALICGDTLFNAGAGNCHNGGDPEVMYETFANQLMTLPERTRIYPGHDYISHNLAFTLDREPDNQAAASMLKELEASHDPANARITTIAEEREWNSFFRLRSPSVIEQLRKDFPDLPDAPTPREVFLKLRELRNHW